MMMRRDDDDDDDSTDLVGCGARVERREYYQGSRVPRRRSAARTGVVHQVAPRCVFLYASVARAREVWSALNSRGSLPAGAGRANKQ